MAMLAIYDLETSSRLERAEYSFEFEGRKFRLVRGGDSQFDTLYTILQDWQEEEVRAYETVLRLCDCWSWWWKTGVHCEPRGGIGLSPEAADLEKLPNLPSARRRTSSVVNPEHVLAVSDPIQRFALGLKNEAVCTKSPFFRFVNYWKILELDSSASSDGAPEDRAMQWINPL